MNIGLTGGIATGKSTVSALLVAKGALLIDADAIAREVMLPGHPVLAAVIQ
ncbi:dephospho-CoA kinase, partial [Bacillus cereus]|nr:dephospho-CoA kinase [Bacillus cereus]